jgi:hypothetical protein
MAWRRRIVVFSVDKARMLVLHAGAFVREDWSRYCHWSKLPPCRRYWVCESSVRSHNILGQVHVECRSRERSKVKLDVFWLDSRSQPSALLSNGRCPAKGRRAVGESVQTATFCRLVSCVVFRLFFCQHHPAYSMHAWQIGLNTFTWYHHLHLSTKHPSFRLVDNLTIHHHLLEDWRIDVRESKFNSETSALKTTHSCSRPTRSGRVSEQSTAVHSHPQTRL